MGATVKETRVKGLSQPAIQQVLFSDALDQSHFLVFVADEFMDYLAVNKTACDILGYTREELLSLRGTDVAVGPDVPEVYRGLIKMGSRKGSHADTHEGRRSAPFVLRRVRDSHSAPALLPRDRLHRRPRTALTKKSRFPGLL